MQRLGLLRRLLQVKLEARGWYGLNFRSVMRPEVYLCSER